MENRYTFTFVKEDGLNGVIYVAHNGEIREHFVLRESSPDYSNKEVFERWCKEYLEFN